MKNRNSTRDSHHAAMLLRPFLRWRSSMGVELLRLARQDLGFGGLSEVIATRAMPGKSTQTLPGCLISIAAPVA